MFRKVGLLGKGSYGTVHQALSSSGALFAVKSSPLNFSSSLLKERRIYGNFLDCPEIVQCFGNYSSMEEGIHLYNLVLEYAPAGSLWTLMNAYKYNGRRLPEGDVRNFTRMLLRGLSRIHARGYVHCDLKPANILVFSNLDSNGRMVKQLKLADFGLAKEPDSGENPCTGTFRGTPWYMSPESLVFGKLEPKLDIWSLGCVVIEMITGRPAYGTITDIDELKWKIGISKEAPEMPDNLCESGKDFLKRCLAVDPEERWSADELLFHSFVCENSLTPWQPPSSSIFDSADCIISTFSMI